MTSVRCSTESGPGQDRWAGCGAGRDGAAGLDVTRAIVAHGGPARFGAPVPRGPAACDQPRRRRSRVVHRESPDRGESTNASPRTASDALLDGGSRRAAPRRHDRPTVSCSPGGATDNVTARRKKKRKDKHERGPGRSTRRPRPGSARRPTRAALSVGRHPLPGRHQLRGGRRRRSGRLRCAALPGRRRRHRRRVRDSDGRAHLRHLAHLRPGVGPGQIYGFRVPARDPAKILLDPYARQVTSTDYDLIAAASTGVDTLGKVPLAVVVRRPARSTSRPAIGAVGADRDLRGPRRRPHPAAPRCAAGTARHLQGRRPPGRHRTPEEPVGDDAGTAAGAGQRRGARPARHRPAKLLGLLDSRLFRAAPRLRDRTRPGDRRVRRDGRRAARRRHRGRPGRRLQPHLRGRPRPDRRPVLAGPVAGFVLPARRPGHHRNRQHR